MTSVAAQATRKVPSVAGPSSRATRKVKTPRKFETRSVTVRPGYVHDGSEGELYNLADDPLQQSNLWGDPAYAATRGDLVADLWDSQPAAHEPRLALVAPV